MIRRPGITLTEVLITLFVLAIGLMALLTLFPLAALNMVQAVQDDRAARAAANAFTIAAMYRDFRPSNDTLPTPGDKTLHTADFFLTGGGPQPPDDAPSYPIYIDPIGFRAGSAWLGNYANLVRRLESPWINWVEDPRLPPQKPTWIAENFFLQDDLVFDRSGVPVGNPQGGLARERRYSWAYLMRRPRTATASVVQVTVVVYSGRGVLLNPGEGEMPASAHGAAGNPFVDVPQLPGGVMLRKGTWVFDVTRAVNADDLMQNGPVHACFYRVTNVLLQSNGQVRLELQTPLRAPVRHLMFMANVVEVFEKGPGWQEPQWRGDQ